MKSYTMKDVCRGQDIKKRIARMYANRRLRQKRGHPFGKETKNG